MVLSGALFDLMIDIAVIVLVTPSVQLIYAVAVLFNHPLSAEFKPRMVQLNLS